MRRIGLMLATSVLVGGAAHAQLLGGGTGSIGGGLGGSVGGLSGNIGGMARGSINNSVRTDDSLVRRDRLEARRLRTEQRRADRVTSGSVAIDGRIDSPIAKAAGHGDIGAVRPALPEFASLRERVVRREAALSARGLRVVSRTRSGVGVFLPRNAISVVGTTSAAYPYPYPVASGGYAYGGGVDTVVVADPGYMDRQYEDLRDDVAGSGVTVERRGEDVVLQLPADVTFAFDRVDIQPRFLPALDAVARTIANYRGTDVEIVGHTDSIGSDAYNYALSQRRGTSVADFLVSRDAEPQRLIVEAMGESEPIASNSTIAGRAANRRVEIILHPQGA